MKNRSTLLLLLTVLSTALCARTESDTFCAAELCHWLNDALQLLIQKDKEEVLGEFIHVAGQEEYRPRDRTDAQEILKTAVLSCVYNKAIRVGQEYNQQLCGGCLDDTVIANTARSMHQNTIAILRKSPDLNARVVLTIFRDVEPRVKKNILFHYRS